MCVAHDKADDDDDGDEDEEDDVAPLLRGRSSWQGTPRSDMETLVAQPDTFLLDG